MKRCRISESQKLGRGGDTEPPPLSSKTAARLGRAPFFRDVPFSRVRIWDCPLSSPSQSAIRNPQSAMRGRIWIKGLLLAVFAVVCVKESISGEGEELTIVYTGSTNGALWPCYECSPEPKGGLARRATLLYQLREELPDFLLLDTGDLLSARGRPIGDRKVLEMYGLLGYDAITVGDQEFINGRTFFETEVLGARLPMISASLWDKQTDRLLLPPYVVKTISDVRVGVIGLVDAQAFMVLKPSAHQGIRVASITETLARYLPEVREKADVVVILSHLGIEGDRDLAEEVRGIHLIIGGHSGGASREPLSVGETLIVRTGPGGEVVGRLDLTLNAESQIEAYTYALIPLDATIPDDLAVEESLADVPAWEAGSQKEVMPSIATGRLFTESERCRSCHPGAFEAWRQSGHAQAFDTLPTELRGNFGCLPCHATGWAKGGYIDEQRTPDLKHVGCASCHRMRRKHLSWPAKSPVPDVAEADCRRCHTAKWTPDFEYGPYWSEIAHSGDW